MKAEKLGDEKELQSYFIRRIEKFLNAKGKRLIGWDEILEGGLAPQATVMSWRGTEGGIAAAKAGHDVVMSPTSHCYIDYYQGSPAYEPPGIGGYLPLSKVYEFEPVPDVLTEAEAKHVLGGQVNLWTEYVSDGRHAEYMALPRLAALAEAVWSPKTRRDWEDFAGRIRALLARYDAAGLNAARSAFLVAIRAGVEPDGAKIRVRLETEIPGLTIRLTTDGSDPGPDSKLYVKPFAVKKTTEVRAAAFEGRERLSPAVSAERFLVHAASGRRAVLAFPFSEKYPGGGDLALTDGLLGSKDMNDGRWQGFEGPDLDAVVDLGAARIRSPDRGPMPPEHQLLGLPAVLGRVRRLLRRQDLRDRGRDRERRPAAAGRRRRQGLRGRVRGPSGSDSSGSGPGRSASSPIGISGRAARPGSSPTRSSSSRRAPVRRQSSFLWKRRTLREKSTVPMTRSAAAWSQSSGQAAPRSMIPRMMTKK